MVLVFYGMRVNFPGLTESILDFRDSRKFADIFANFICHVSKALFAEELEGLLSFLLF